MCLRGLKSPQEALGGLPTFVWVRCFSPARQLGKENPSGFSGRKRQRIMPGPHALQVGGRGEGEVLPPVSHYVRVRQIPPAIFADLCGLPWRQGPYLLLPHLWTHSGCFIKTPWLIMNWAFSLRNELPFLELLLCVQPCAGHSTNLFPSPHCRVGGITPF